MSGFENALISIFISYSGFFINQWVQPTKIKRQSHYFVSKCRYSMSYISLCFRSSLWIFSWLWLLSPFKSRVNQNWKKQKSTKIRLYEYKYIFISIYHSSITIYCKKRCWSNSFLLFYRNHAWILPSMLHLWNVTCQKNELVSNIGFGGLLSRHRSSTSSWP